MQMQMQTNFVLLGFYHSEPAKTYDGEKGFPPFFYFMQLMHGWLRVSLFADRPDPSGA
jgi:hypothetical protein